MAIEIKMPQLSDTMDAGKILLWEKQEGDPVKRGDILAEVETDKANLQIESFQQGVLLKIVVPAQGTAKVGEVIALVGKEGETVDVSKTSNANSEEKTKEVELAHTENTTPQIEVIQKETSNPDTSTNQNHSEVASSTDRIKASPLAKKLATQNKVDLSQLTGSGPNGRIIKKDVEAVASSSGERPSSSAPSSSSPSPVQSSAKQFTAGATPLSKMRETIARRMQESVRDNPHFYVTTSINMKECSDLRAILKENPEFKGISINHFVIKATAYALTKERSVNSAMKDGQLYSPSNINIGIVTAIPDGLLIPVVKDADSLSLKDLVFEARAAIDRARAGRPSASDLSGGTFSISNMGMFDVENFTAIINPGQGGILAVSSIKEEPIVENGVIKIGLKMKVTLSVDHRIIDGVMAGNWLSHFKAALEKPALMFL